jgi:hypothetical protein
MAVADPPLPPFPTPTPTPTPMPSPPAPDPASNVLVPLPLELLLLQPIASAAQTPSNTATLRVSFALARRRSVGRGLALGGIRCRR